MTTMCSENYTAHTIQTLIMAGWASNNYNYVASSEDTHKNSWIDSVWANICVDMDFSLKGFWPFI